MNICGAYTESICLAAKDDTPIEAPVDDGFFARGKSFFLYTLSRVKDGVGGWFTKISGKKVAKYRDITLNVGADEQFLLFILPTRICPGQI